MTAAVGCRCWAGGYKERPRKNPPVAIMTAPSAMGPRRLLETFHADFPHIITAASTAHPCPHMCNFSQPTNLFASSSGLGENPLSSLCGDATSYANQIYLYLLLTGQVLHNRPPPPILRSLVSHFDKLVLFFPLPHGHFNLLEILFYLSFPITRYSLFASLASSIQ